MGQPFYSNGSIRPLVHRVRRKKWRDSMSPHPQPRSILILPTPPWQSCAVHLHLHIILR
ncbi:hypothetical protein BJV78DRAFT_1162461 [Lactifluus subvellereus]|nr:hypothetical protein BJV78DRAFT_1162461 [Lactifluus subvellereus]